MNTEIVSDLAGLAKDPLSFVYWAFPWGEGLLTHQDGPEAWQKEILGHIGENVSPDKVIQEAVASGHGIGKSALVSKKSRDDHRRASGSPGKERFQ